MSLSLENTPISVLLKNDAAKNETQEECAPGEACATADRSGKAIFPVSIVVSCVSHLALHSLVNYPVC